MNEKVLSFNPNNKIYLDLAEKKANDGKIEEAISLLYPVFIKNRSIEIAEKLATLYARIKTYDLSNMYWFFYLDNARKEERGKAYFSLGVNAFYFGNLELTKFYFQKKVEEDGFIDREELSPEILNFFTNEDDKNKGFKIVYPPSEADNKYEIETAKNMIASGNIFGAKIVLSKIKNGSKEYLKSVLSLAEIAVLDEDCEKALKYCDEYLTKTGESALVHFIKVCAYAVKKDYDKAEYYYKKGLTIIDETDSEQVFKAGICAIELKHDDLVEKYFSIFLKDQPYHALARFFTAISFLNQKKYEKAKTEFVFLCKLEPDNLCFKFYFDYTLDLIAGKREIMPLWYEEKIPRKFFDADKKLINSLFTIPVIEVRRKLDDSRVFDAVLRGVKSGNGALVKNSVAILSGSEHKKAERALFDCLLDEREYIETKKSVVYSLIAIGYKKKFSVSIEGVFVKIKPQKFSFEKDHPELILPYAYCMSKLTLEDYSAQDEIGRISKKVIETVKFDAIENIAEISAVIACIFFGDKLSCKAVCSLFNADFDKTKQFLDLYKGIEKAKRQEKV